MWDILGEYTRILPTSQQHVKVKNVREGKSALDQETQEI